MSHNPSLRVITGHLWSHFPHSLIPRLSLMWGRKREPVHVPNFDSVCTCSWCKVYAIMMNDNFIVQPFIFVSHTNHVHYAWLHVWVKWISRNSSSLSLWLKVSYCAGSVEQMWTKIWQTCPTMLLSMNNLRANEPSICHRPRLDMTSSSQLFKHSRFLFLL